MRRLIILLTMIFFVHLALLPLVRAQVPSSNRNDVSDAEEDNLVRWLNPIYREWLAEDVAYIITREERRAFLQLENEADRDFFIERFWQRRNPVPDSQENTFEAEHYRRIAYSNEHLSAEGVDGWKTDRGRIYIEWGPPDATEVDSFGVTGLQETWRYRYLEGIGENVEFEFIDPRRSGDYRLALQPAEQNHFYQPKGPETLECTGCIRSLAEPSMEESPRFSTRFKDLEAVAVTHLKRDDVNFAYHFAAVPVTSFTTLVQMTLEIPSFELGQQSNETDKLTRLNLFCRISDPNGRVVETFEDTISPALADSAPQYSTGTYFFQKSIPLRVGLYDLAIVVGNPESGRVGSTYTELAVPAITRFADSPGRQRASLQEEMD